MAIERIEVFITDLPGRLQRQVSSGAYDTGAPGSLSGKPVLVRVFADGVVGVGQIRPISPGHFLPDTVDSMVSAITKIYGPRMIGMDPFDLEAIWALFDRVLPKNVNARAAIDHALHDLIGKTLGIPVYKLLGGLSQPRIPLEWSVSMADDQARMIAESERALHEFNIRILCLKAGDSRGWRRDVENFASVRRVVGDDIVMGVDPNTGWSLPDAKRAIAALAEYGLDYVEQPIERHDIAGLADIRKTANGIPIMADESLTSLQDAYALAKARAVDVFCIKPYKVGGLGQARKIAALAEASNILINVGGLAAFCQLEAAAGAHFYASTPAHRVMPGGEFIFGLGVIGPDPLVPANDFVINDGHVTPPSGPGLGICIDEAALEKHKLWQETVK